MSYQDFTQEVQNMGEKLVLKLQNLPQADPVEITAFTLILVFIAMVLVMATLACSVCCCSCDKHRTVKVQPKAQV
ncbi:small integral membrane protein 5 [Hyperolius riggenbachi]|uniref:small integral membrane protein 5 n=1 Tax=Hyperolius riggenbachi TaxID=752182 RepID=UPI0035A29FE4